VTGIDFTLVQSVGTRISGRVKGAPAGATGIRVLLQQAAPIPLGSTSIQLDTAVLPDGAFQFPKVPPGAYNVRLNPAAAGTPLRIEVVDKDINDLEIVAPRMALGRVTVDDGSKLPVQGAAVIAGVPDPPALLQLQARRVGSGTSPSAAVKADGTFLLVNLGAGEFRLALPLTPFGYWIKSMTFGSVDLTRDMFKTVDDPAVTMPEIRIVLTREPPDKASAGVTVSGRVVGLPENTAGSSRWVMMQSQPTTITASGIAERRQGEAPVSPDGTFTIRHVPPGSYSARAMSTDRIIGTTTAVVVGEVDVNGVELSVTTLPQPSPGIVSGIGTGPASAGTPLQIVIPGVKVSGKVATAPGTPAPQGVALFGAADRSVRADVAPDGSFEFAKVPAGAYDLAVLPLTMPAVFTKVTVGSVDLVGLRIETPRQATARGRIVTAPANRLPGTHQLTLSLRSTSASVRIPIQANGTFSATLIPGEYQATIEGVPGNFKVQSIVYGATNILNAPAKIDSQTDEFVITLSLAP
jgi:hypothetical protein